MGALHITAGEFYDLDAVEFHYALKTVRRARQAQGREAYEIARLQAVLIINPTLKTPFKEPQDYIQFSWEKKKEKGQSLEDMKKQVLSLGVLFAGDNPVGHKKLDDPPTVLAHPKEEK